MSCVRQDYYFYFYPEGGGCLESTASDGDGKTHDSDAQEIFRQAHEPAEFRRIKTM